MRGLGEIFHREEVDREMKVEIIESLVSVCESAPSCFRNSREHFSSLLTMIFSEMIEGAHYFDSDRWGYPM